MSDYLDDNHQRIAEFAEDFLEEDEREGFVDSLLERHGYQKQTAWAPPEPQGGGQGGRQPLVKPRRQQPRGGGQRARSGQQAPRGSYFK